MSQGQVPRPSASRWSLRRWWLGASLLLVLLLLGSMISVGWAIADLTRARTRLLDTIGPAVVSVQQLGTALVNQETGVRGYTLSGRAEFLTPYQTGVADAAKARGTVAASSAELPWVGADLEQLDRAIDAWRTVYAEPVIAATRAGAPPLAVEAGKAEFDAVRSALSTLQSKLEDERTAGRAALNTAASRLATTCVITLGALLLVVLIGVGLMTTSVVRPLSRLANHVRQVAAGDFDHPVVVSGPREVVSLGHDVESMRDRVVAELERAQAAGRDLARSNAELEQFAYVASHDLQEPLRKVASFCQLLERRYKGQLDEKAGQYIGFAVDGALRMQVLINDLLAFSRVGRHTGKHADHDATALAEQATRNLTEAITAADATVTIDPLPAVHGEAPLLTSVFQNLIGNGIKFRGTEPPTVTITADRDGPNWTFSVTDNGIGIEPQFADRVFVIFQRLHAKDSYPGTGIGLAMCRKIIEFHGGTIWIDTTHSAGTRVRFTLPALDTPTDT
ncbi:sensor histidine kinase [Actinokineospora globicatena]|uniref:sensor histidine kinase n=1 Tax=Actinokineospora globicatena TaxID=103729 RepID=UPI0020A4B9EA|nr:sensor histidine kinase [Actinokineospora globicatena]MCP2305906.1 His Kinase A (phospho-acceptor) domain-containing protein [Actinokineospora globicatena]GLW80225.1 histidine kinase [Actinokineospora globicatena]